MAPAAQGPPGISLDRRIRQSAWAKSFALAKGALVLTAPVLLCSSGEAQSASADASLSITPTAEDLKAELLAHGMRPPQRSGLPCIRTGRLAQRSASDAITSLPFSPTQQEPQALVAFPQAASCPPEFWGELFTHISIKLHGLFAGGCPRFRLTG